MDKYEKVRKIGEGSFGKAILVRSKEDGRQYVIKEIGISRMSNKERRESRKEVAVLANMSHPNIVQYKASFEESGCLYIVMDYCEGGDLFKKINNQNGVLFPEEQILDWFVQICLALKHVHERKILHRDIKSQNIFLTKDGTVQLGDFGIARVLNSTVELARTCIGTPYYLSPEICENKPYNNKSDIWALGCVLYEMCTLKHAFEAGNMKNLVLKIIRGSYPPVSVNYSQDLQTLLGQLFKRNPRERPSVSAILDKPFLARRIHKLLSPQLIDQEFTPEVGQLLQQPKMNVAQGLPAKHPAPGQASVTPAHKITKPAAKYGVPLTAKRPADPARRAADAVRKPAERKPVIKHKQAPPPAAVQRRINRVEDERRKREEGVRKKRMEPEREWKQKEQMFLLKAAQVKRFEKEKLNRIHRAREQGWKHVLSSSGGSSPERKVFGGGGIGALPTPLPGHSLLLGPAHVPPSLPGPVLASNEESKAADNVRPAMEAGMPNGHACLPDHDSVKKEARRTSLQNESVSKNDHANRLRVQVAAERAKQVDEFLQRKQEALLNKVRAEGQLGARQNLAAIFASRTNSSRGRRPRVNKEEEEYLTRLRQIRLQNFNERQQIKARLRGEKRDGEGSDSQESSEEMELRRKRIDTLKAQSKARAAVLKEQLEKKRREAYEREKKAWEDHLAARGVKIVIGPATATPTPHPAAALPPQPEHIPQDAARKAKPYCRPTTPAISMTAALKDVGVVTSAQNSPMNEEPSKPETTDVQSERKEILRRLNQNLKDHIAEKEHEQNNAPASGPDPTPQTSQPIIEERPTTGGERRRWEAGGPPVLSVAQQTLEDTCSTMAVSEAVSPEENALCAGDRKRWQPGAVALSVAQQTLEETSLTTAEKTSGEVIPMEAWQGKGLGKAWEKAPVSEGELQQLCDDADTKNLTITLGPSDDSDKTTRVPQPQPSQASLGQDQNQAVVELDQQAAMSTDEEQQATAIGQDPDQGSECQNTLSVVTSIEEKPGLSEPSLAEGTDEVESLVLEEGPRQTFKPQVEVMKAWGQEALPQPRPDEGSVIPAEPQKDEDGVTAEEDKQITGSVEAAFVKLSCSPAHRRAVALSALSAQSSAEDSSSSVASRSRSVSPQRSGRPDDALLFGLSTGLFDTNNPKMLRTCSLPDLGKLFSGLTETDVASTHGPNLELEDLEDKEEEQSDNDVYEDEDLRELRASMERLLQQQRSDDDDDNISGGSPPDEDENAGLNGQDKCSPAEEDSNSIADDEEEVSPEEEARGLTSNGHYGAGDEEQHSERQLNEEWQSDDSEEEEESDLEQQDSIFSRLEELRFNLEQAMGFEQFIQAYNKIKAIHEDEDENIDMGSSMVQSILQPEHQHLYPKILHLVMADGAYQEDNDE
ncbi:serine/threonine-protein kinase Nek1 isoform X2 [Trichomycterus rosablanca]|uniref:serine/threonine-protein kinase Nek1 isoform X2 n=1 Tax=Trichomycterus rosablanca TaxID=2290929 RepID=UPI002F3592E5